LVLAERSLQAQIPHNHCFGCGPANKAGLNLESFWTGEGPSVARFVPQQHHCAAPLHFVNGGILATLIDCHCICTAYAAGYRDKGRAIGTKPAIHFVTGAMTLRYLRPVPIAGPLELFAEISARTDTGYRVSCTLESEGKTRVSAEVTAVEVSDAWMQQNEQ
jgi:acyl-coenzyme A thioesterase PaaI-like protein